jgi:hypothetical protein
MQVYVFLLAKNVPTCWPSGMFSSIAGLLKSLILFAPLVVKLSFTLESRKEYIPIKARKVVLNQFSRETQIYELIH